MSKKRILIVDDNWDILFLLAHSAKRLTPELEVVTASDGRTALDKIQKQPFDLVLTDHVMPEMTGVELARKIRAIAPNTSIFLMTAYEANRLTEDVKDIGLDGFIGKPFKIPDVLATIRQTLKDLTPDGPIASPTPAPLLQPPQITARLQQLWNETSVRTVLLLNTDGEPLQAVGEAGRAETTRLATFVAGTFLAVSEFATLLGDHQSSFTSSYHEGTRYNIYAHRVNNDLLLAVVFNADRKPGPIWVYTKQAASAIAAMVED
ncbi:MAG: response regulator [Caldilineae bacterium]|nr:MAG: response regulator [Caldilineae bacterium]